MPLTDDQVARAARDVYQAWRSGVPDGPADRTAPGHGPDRRLRVQQELVALLTADGDRVTGYKLGLTSAPMQALMGVDSPDFAPVLASHLRQDGATVTAGSFIARKVEAEIALVLRDGLASPDCTEQDVAAAVSGAVAALEIVDSRITDWQIALADTVADLASSGAVVLARGSGPMALTCG